MKIARGLRILVAIAAVGVSHAQQTPPAATNAPPDVKIETVNIAPGIYMLLGRGGNVGVSAGADGVAIIDDQFADMAPKIRAAVALLAEQPVSFVINTHLHGDHTGGNAVFGRAGAVILAHDNVRKRLSVPVVNPMTGNTTPAQPPEALPVVTFADGATLHLNGEELAFTHLPNAHTDTDIVVRFRKANVLHMGDTFVGGFPFIDANSGGTLDGLIAGHDKIIASIDDSTRLIRGHGPLGNKAELIEYRNMLVTVRDRIARLVKAGKSQDEVVAAQPTREFDARYGGANFNARQWVERAYVDQKYAAEAKKKKR